MAQISRHQTYTTTDRTDTGTIHGTTITTAVCGATEDGMTLGTTDTTLGTMALITEVTTADTMGDTTAVSTTHGITVTIHGSTADGIQDGMTHGTTEDGMEDSMDTCILITAVGTADGTLTITAYISDLHTEDTTALSATHPDEAYTEARAITPHQARLSHPAAELLQKTHPVQSAGHQPPQGLHSEPAILQQAGRLQEEALQHTGNRQQDQLRVLRNHPVLLTTEVPQEVHQAPLLLTTEAQATLQVLAAAITEVRPEEVTAEEVIAEAAVMAGAATAEAVRAAEDKHTKIIKHEKDSNYNPYGIGSGKRLCTDCIQRVDA